MPTSRLTHEIITAAIDGFEAQKKRIDSQITELRHLLKGGSNQAPAAPEPKQPKRKISAAVRKRMGEAQRKRWATVKGEAKPQFPASTPEAPKTKRKLSAAGRRRIIEATKKRWARIRAEQAKKAAAAKKPKRGKSTGANRGATAAAATGD